MTNTDRPRDYHLTEQLDRAADLRCCRDCTELFYLGTAPYPWCQRCRVRHTVKCRICKTAYPIDGDASGLCPLHREHPTLPLGGAE